jgi:hypothetical protein
MVAIQNYMIFINDYRILQACKVFELKDQFVRYAWYDRFMSEQRRNTNHLHFQRQCVGLDTVHG